MSLRSESQIISLIMALLKLHSTLPTVCHLNYCSSEKCIFQYHSSYKCMLIWTSCVRRSRDSGCDSVSGIHCGSHCGYRQNCTGSINILNVGCHLRLINRPSIFKSIPRIEWCLFTWKHWLYKWIMFSRKNGSGIRDLVRNFYHRMFCRDTCNEMIGGCSFGAIWR